jgi:hypothetical protein
LVYGAVAVACLFLLAPRLSAQVNRDELGTPGDLEFINYVGPHATIDTLTQIHDIGYGLGLSIRNGAAQAGETGRYFVIRSRSGPDASKIDADIFGLGPDVAVDHIRNLRLIIQGYLEAVYDYSESDAALLSRYVTIYNAVYRGDMDYFGSRYKDPVMVNVTQERAGLSIRYDEWPGQTLILIPLGSGGGPLSAVDTATLSDDRVLEQLRQEPDMSIDDRREMVGLMERQADEASQQAEIIRETISQEEQSIPEERQAAQQQVQAAQEEQRQIEAERQQPGADQQALDQRQEEAQQQEQEATQALQELDQREEALEDMRQEAEAQETFAEERRDDAQEARQQIAEDQQSIIERPAVAAGEGILGISILDPGNSLGRLVMIGIAGEEIRRSELNTVNARTVTIVGNRIFAIAGTSQGSGAIRLVEIDPVSLTMLNQGNDDIAQGSLLWLRGQDLYAITSTGGVLNLARFDTDMVVQARSSIEVHQYASVFFNGGFLLTQRSDGSAALLDPRDLTERSENN